MPYNNPIKKKDSACKQLKSETGKPSGLMMEGSVAYQESAEQEKKDLMKDMPIDNKASALTMGHEDSPAEMGHSPMEMGHESPAKNVNKGYGYETPKPSVAKMGHESPAKFTGMSGGSAMHMSPLNNHKIDPKTGKAIPHEFLDPGPDPSQGFIDDSRPYDYSGGKGQYDSEEASRRFMGAQKQAQNALNIAEQQLGGTDVINQKIQGYGSSSISGPSAAQVITGYSTNPEGKVVFEKSNVQAKLNELKKLAITDPVKARSVISSNISSAPLGDFRSKFRRDVNPLNRPK